MRLLGLVGRWRNSPCQEANPAATGWRLSIHYRILGLVRLNPGNVEISGDLVSAHTDGRLVLFVGAGASVDPPSGLPRFSELATNIAEKSRQPPPQEDLPLDRELGRMKDAGADVHQLAKDIIGDPLSEPNKLHEAIVELASQYHKPRIITTNYDRHLSTCLLERGEFDEYPSRAFPQWEDFTGIVYLHGSVKEPADRLVVTDGDFAETYLLAPWTASQFLGRLFSSSTVLFIGYSHSDTLMEYLARGLPAESKRYVLCDNPEDEKWGTFRIEPIGIGNNGALPELLRDWARQAQMGALDHDQRLRGIVQTEPPPDDDPAPDDDAISGPKRNRGNVRLPAPEDESYLRETFEVVERLRLFTRHAREVGWLSWAEEEGLLGGIFDPVASSETADVLSEWFAELATAQATADEALRVFDGNGRQFSQGLWAKMLIEVGKSLENRATESGQARRWVPMVALAAPRGAHTSLGLLLDACHAGGYMDEGLLVLDCLLAPAVRLERSFDEDSAEGRKPAIDGPSRWAGHHWEGTIRQRLSEEGLAAEVVAIADRHLRTAHRIAADGDREGNWKWVSLERSAIEEHEQDISEGGIHVLVDVARDSLEALLEHDPRIGGRYLVSWAASEMPLLRRLAIHGWAESQDATADAKVEWLRESGLVSDRYMCHEAMRLLATALPEASEEAADEMVAHVLEGLSESPENEGAEGRDRSVYDYLAWIASHAPELASAQEALELVQARYPDWEPNDHPDFLIWTSSEFGDWAEAEEATDADRLHDLIQVDPRRAAVFLQSIRSDASSGGWADERWHSALSVLRGLAEEHAEVGLAMIDFLLDGGGTGDLDDDQWIADAILGAWVDAEIGDDLFDPVVARLLRIWETGASNWTRGTGIYGGQVGPLTHAINHWSGRMAQIALRSASYEHRHNVTSGAGLSERLKGAMEAMITGGDTPNEYAQVVVAGQVRFLFAVDEQWCRARVLPLLDPQVDRDTAERCWDGYLHAGGAHPALLEAGLLASFLNIAPYADRWGDIISRAFYRLLAAIALFTGINPVEHGWLDDFIAHAEPRSRVRWIAAVRSGLADLSASAADAQWDSWMRDYWERRLRSIPLPMTPEEASHISEWAAYLGERFPQAVELATQFNAPIAELLPAALGRFGDESDRSDHLALHPEHAAQLLTHHLANTPAFPPIYGTLLSAYLEEIVPILLDRLDPEDAAPLRTEATRLGIPTEAR